MIIFSFHYSLSNKIYDHQFIKTKALSEVCYISTEENSWKLLVYLLLVICSVVE